MGEKKSRKRIPYGNTLLRVPKKKKNDPLNPPKSVFFAQNGRDSVIPLLTIERDRCVIIGTALALRFQSGRVGAAAFERNGNARGGGGGARELVHCLKNLFFFFIFLPSNLNDNNINHKCTSRKARVNRATSTAITKMYKHGTRTARSSADPPVVSRRHWRGRSTTYGGRRTKPRTRYLIMMHALYKRGKTNKRPPRAVS